MNTIRNFMVLLIAVPTIALGVLSPKTAQQWRTEAQKAIAAYKKNHSIQHALKAVTQAEKFRDAKEQRDADKIMQDVAQAMTGSRNSFAQFTTKELQKRLKEMNNNKQYPAVVYSAGVLVSMTPNEYQNYLRTGTVPSWRSRPHIMIIDRYTDEELEEMGIYAEEPTGPTRPVVIVEEEEEEIPADPREDFEAKREEERALEQKRKAQELAAQQKKEQTKFANDQYNELLNIGGRVAPELQKERKNILAELQELSIDQQAEAVANFTAIILRITENKRSFNALQTALESADVVQKWDTLNTHSPALERAALIYRNLVIEELEKKEKDAADKVAKELARLQEQQREDAKKREQEIQQTRNTIDKHMIEINKTFMQQRPELSEVLIALTSLKDNVMPNLKKLNAKGDTEYVYSTLSHINTSMGNPEAKKDLATLSQFLKNAIAGTKNDIKKEEGDRAREKKAADDLAAKIKKEQADAEKAAKELQKKIEQQKKDDDAADLKIFTTKYQDSIVNIALQWAGTKKAAMSYDDKLKVKEAVYNRMLDIYSEIKDEEDEKMQDALLSGYLVWINDKNNSKEYFENRTFSATQESSGIQKAMTFIAEQSKKLSKELARDKTGALESRLNKYISTAGIKRAWPNDKALVYRELIRNVEYIITKQISNQQLIDDFIAWVNLQPYLEVPVRALDEIRSKAQKLLAIELKRN